MGCLKLLEDENQRLDLLHMPEIVFIIIFFNLRNDRGRSPMRNPHTTIRHYETLPKSCSIQYPNLARGLYQSILGPDAG